jgi:hypothetical protein
MISPGQLAGERSVREGVSPDEERLPEEGNKEIVNKETRNEGIFSKLFLALQHLQADKTRNLSCECFEGQGMMFLNVQEREKSLPTAVFPLSQSIMLTSRQGRSRQEHLRCMLIVLVFGTRYLKGEYAAKPGCPKGPAGGHSNNSRRMSTSEMLVRPIKRATCIMFHFFVQ